MSTTFDITRFKNLMKYEFAAESKQWVRGMIGFSIALAFIYVMMLWVKKDYLMDCNMGLVKFDEQNYDPYYWFYMNLIGKTMFVWIGMTFAAACNIFKNMGTKQQRISFLALPASNLEKFLARLIWVNVSFLVTFIVGFIVADACLAIASWSFGLGVHGSVITTFFGVGDDGVPIQVFGVEVAEYYLWIALIAFQLFVHSSWTFFGTFFRKNAIVWTMGIAAIGTVLFAKLVAMNDDNIQRMAESLGFYGSFWLIVSLMVCIAVFLYYSAYRIFKGMQVINNKWLNV